MPSLSPQASDILSTMAAPIIASVVAAILMGLSVYDEWSWRRRHDKERARAHARH